MESGAAQLGGLSQRASDLRVFEQGQGVSELVQQAVAGSVGQGASGLMGQDQELAQQAAMEFVGQDPGAPGLVGQDQGEWEFVSLGQGSLGHSMPRLVVTAEAGQSPGRTEVIDKRESEARGLGKREMVGVGVTGLGRRSCEVMGLGGYRMMGLAGLMIQRSRVPGLAGWGQKVLGLEVEGYAVTGRRQRVSGLVDLVTVPRVSGLKDTDYRNTELAGQDQGVIVAGPGMVGQNPDVTGLAGWIQVSRGLEAKVGLGKEIVEASGMVGKVVTGLAGRDRGLNGLKVVGNRVAELSGQSPEVLELEGAVRWEHGVAGTAGYEGLEREGQGRVLGVTEVVGLRMAGLALEGCRVRELVGQGQALAELVVAGHGVQGLAGQGHGLAGERPGVTESVGWGLAMEGYRARRLAVRGQGVTGLEVVGHGLTELSGHDRGVPGHSITKWGMGAPELAKTGHRRRGWAQQDQGMTELVVVGQRVTSLMGWGSGAVGLAGTGQGMR
ncbi:myosin-6 [Platysternon megacephalum]|uniref:Myosin-6 n=1 Tax=Platysternon megacephalum TaxID=55544 RepID=A0A4D9DMP8_9SAUR|nr:myosin-6 [Platysternon megacephalum]